MFSSTQACRPFLFFFFLPTDVPGGGDGEEKRIA